MIQNQEFISEFVEEAQTHIEKLEAILLKKEEDMSSELINEIFREGA
jgi:two-component system chemotaxis sensor kinase CheA